MNWLLLKLKITDNQLENKYEYLHTSYCMSFKSKKTYLRLLLLSFSNLHSITALNTLNQEAVIYE